MARLLVFFFFYSILGRTDFLVISFLSSVLVCCSSEMVAAEMPFCTRALQFLPGGSRKWAPLLRSDRHLYRWLIYITSCPDHTSSTATCCTLDATPSLPHTREFPEECHRSPAVERIDLCSIPAMPHGKGCSEVTARLVTSR